MTYVYMIKDKNNRLYIGVSENPNKRLDTHNRRAGANFTKLGNFKLVFFEKYLSLSEARSREI